MSVETQFIEMSDGAKIALHNWMPQGDARAVVVICHGMIEYAKRYDYAAKKIAGEGFAVFTHDQRGHGETAGTLENAGLFCDDGFSRVVLDAREVILHIKKTLPGKKIVLLGHSFGSFVAQGFIEHYGNEIDACILSGSAGPRRAMMAAALCVIKIVQAFKGKNYRSKFLQSLTFVPYNKNIPGAQSAFAWLSRDTELVKTHDADPWCNFVPATSFFAALTSGLYHIHAKDAMACIPKTLPVLLFSGAEDPVGDYGKTVAALAARYKTNGMTDVTFTLYPEGRHEMLNEINKDQVIADILLWLKART